MATQVEREQLGVNDWQEVLVNEGDVKKEGRLYVILKELEGTKQNPLVVTGAKRVVIQKKKKLVYESYETKERRW